MPTLMQGTGSHERSKWPHRQPLCRRAADDACGSAWLTPCLAKAVKATILDAAAPTLQHVACAETQIDTTLCDSPNENSSTHASWLRKQSKSEYPVTLLAAKRLPVVSRSKPVHLPDVTTHWKALVRGDRTSSERSAALSPRPLRLSAI